MRAAAVAIVLIFGAAVILVFANTLNSLVLGGLIGGLAALLISIPISLFLFTILSRHHDQKLQVLQQELEEMGYAELDENGHAEVYETDFYVVRDEEENYNEPVSRRGYDVRALPAAGQSQASDAANMAFNGQTGRYPQGSRRPSQALRQSSGKGTPAQNNIDRRQQRRSAYEVNAMRSRFQTAALRAARREAAQQFNDVEVIPAHSKASYKRVPSGRSSQHLSEQHTRSRQARPASEMPQQQAANPNDSRRSRGIDTTSSLQYGTNRTISSPEDNSVSRTPQTDSLSMEELKTEQLRSRYQRPETEPFRIRPQTGQIVRNPQLLEQLRNPEMITGNLKNPMVRRAPYMYEDDPLREEFAQQLDGGPIARRSSLFSQSEDEEE
jgi:hypothetical protein